MNQGWTEQELKEREEIFLRSFGKRERREFAESLEKQSKAEDTTRESSDASPKETRSSKP